MSLWLRMSPLLASVEESGSSVSTQLDDFHLPLAEPARSILGNRNGIAKLRRTSILQPEGRLHVEDHSRLKHDLSHGAGRAAARQSAQSAGMNHQCAGFVASGDEPFGVRRA